MKFESFPQSETIEEAPRGFLSILRENISKNTKMATLGALAWLSIESAEAAPKSVEERKDTIHCTLEGEGDRYVEFALTPEVFGETWSSEKLKIEDPRFIELVMGDEEIAETRFIKQSQNREKWDALMEAQLQRPEILEKAGIKTAEEAENPTPGQAALISKEIILGNFHYNTDTAEAYKDILESSPEEYDEKVDTYREELKSFNEGMQQKTPEDILGEKMDITCAQSTELYEYIFTWLKEKHGEKLKNAFARRHAGVLALSDNYEETNHAWNKVVLLEDVNSDGVVDGAEVVFVDATPLTVEQESEEAIERSAFELAQAAQAMGKLREQGILSEGELRELYTDFQVTLGDFAQKAGMAPSDLDSMMHAIIFSITRGGHAFDASEKEFFDLERAKYSSRQ